MLLLVARVVTGNANTAVTILTGNHDCLGISSKAVFEQPGEYRVSVWDEGVLPGTRDFIRQVSCNRRQTGDEAPHHNYALSSTLMDMQGLQALILM